MHAYTSSGHLVYHTAWFSLKLPGSYLQVLIYDYSVHKGDRLYHGCMILVLVAPMHNITTETH